MTVSRVVAGFPNIREETRQRVSDAIREMGYSPNTAARHLAAGPIRIGLLHGNPSETYTSQLLISFLTNSVRSGWQPVMEHCTSPRACELALDRLLKGGVDAVILPTPLGDSPRLARRLRKAKIPSVALATGRKEVDGLSVRIDNYQAALVLTRYLLSLGHREIGFIRGHPDQIESDQRYRGYEDALKEAGVPVNREWVQQGYYTYRSGLAAAEKLLALESRPTAIFASNDDMAAGALAAAHKRKLDVPRDLSIVGFDDTPLATAIWPSLTTIRQPVDKLMQLAFRLALDELRHRRSGAPPGRREELAELELVKRESAAAIAT